MIRIGIVEDNPQLRGSLESLFNRTEGMRCVVSLNNLLNVVSEVGSAKPDIILMDIGLPNISGIEGVRTVKTHFPEILVGGREPILPVFDAHHGVMIFGPVIGLAGRGADTVPS